MTTSYPAPLASDIGTDLLCGDDLDPLSSLVSGNALAIQVATHRLTTPPNSLLDSEDYECIDLAALCSQATTKTQALAIPGQIRSVLIAEELFVGADATVAPDGKGGLTITITIDLGQGPFPFVFPVADAPAAFFGGA